VVFGGADLLGVLGQQRKFVEAGQLVVVDHDRTLPRAYPPRVLRLLRRNLAIAATIDTVDEAASPR